MSDEQLGIPAITRLISPAGPTPENAVKMNVFNAYRIEQYGEGELPVFLRDLKNPNPQKPMPAYIERRLRAKGE